MRPASIYVPLFAALALAASGCTFEGPIQHPDGGSIYFNEGDHPNAQINGLSYDFETFIYNYNEWPPEGNPSPDLTPDSPFLHRAAIKGAMPSIIDLLGKNPEVKADKATGDDGLWRSAAGVPERPDLPYFTKAVVDPKTGVASTGEGGYTGAQYPTVLTGLNYLPTITHHKMFVNRPTCYYQLALMWSDAGALEAVAKYKTSHGTPTTVQDLLDPSKYGAVAVLFFGPEVFYEFSITPNFNVDVKVSDPDAELIPINWDFPAGSPIGTPSTNPDLSRLGFEVSDKAELGYFVLLLPAGHTGPITLNATDIEDPNTSPLPGHPYQYPADIKLNVQPKVVNYLRVFGNRTLPPKPENPLAEDPRPNTDYTWSCLDQIPASAYE